MIPSLRLEIALKFAEAGYRLFPTRPNSKKEFKKGHIYDRSHATTDRATIKGWGTSTDRQLQNCNFKALIPGGACVVDIEPTPEADGDLYDWLIEREVIDPNGLGNTTADGGYHFFVFGLDTLTIEQGFFWLTDEDAGIPTGKVEVRGPGTDIMLPCSVVNGIEYRLIKGNCSIIPYFLYNRILEHNETFAPKKEEAQTPTETRTEGKTTDADRAYANAALTNNIAKLIKAEKGTRWKKLATVSVIMGNYAHILGAEDITATLLKAIEDWGRPGKNKSTIAAGLKIGEQKPKFAPKNVAKAKALAQTALSEFETQLDAMTWGGKLTGSNGRVRALSARDALKTIVKRGQEVGNLDVVVSQRWLAETANMSTRTAWKTLTAMQDTSLLQITRKGSTLSGEAHIYHLTGAGFAALLELRRVESAQSENPKVSQVIERDCGKDMEVLSSTKGTAFVSLSNTCLTLGFSQSIESAAKMGIFTNGVLGRSARFILERLAVGPMASAELADLTGLSYTTVQRVVDRLEHFKFLAKGGRGQAHTLKLDTFNKAILDVESTRNTVKKMSVKHEMFNSVRTAYKTQLAEYLKEREEAQSIEAQREEYLQKADWIDEQ